MVEVFLAQTVDYRLAWRWQQKRVEPVADGNRPEALLLLGHPHVITLGRGSHAEHVLISEDERNRRGIQLVEVDRGGDVTYHGPGQLVGYPILRFAQDAYDARRYLRDLEEVLIRALRDYGVAAGRKERYTGVWVGDEKIAAIGVKLHRLKDGGFITSHGFAVNVHTDLDFFRLIVPCGIREYGVTSLRQLGIPCTTDELAERVIGHFQDVFQRPLRVMKVEQLSED
ncbi:MAG: lipoyl(octanoyl) transferase [Bacillaceae bacterium G1]|nr:MAG: lipoyl(octanoyl) transferase [Bacillaceae bacterium G1]